MNNDISGTHAKGLVGMFPQRIFEKKCNLVRFDVSLHTILGPPDKFLGMLYAAPLRSVS